LLLEHKQQIFCLDLVSDIRELFYDLAFHGRLDSRLHFHRLQHQEAVALFHLFAQFHDDA
jgi:hypothetical protein